MNIVFEADTYKVPAFALPALVNGDYTGIMDDDEAFVDNLCEWLNGQYGEVCGTLAKLVSSISVDLTLKTF